MVPASTEFWMSSLLQFSQSKARRRFSPTASDRPAFITPVLSTRPPGKPLVSTFILLPLRSFTEAMRPPLNAGMGTAKLAPSVSVVSGLRVAGATSQLPVTIP